MFTVSLRRLIRHRCCPCISSNNLTPARRLYQQATPTTRPAHQRRYSSSNASIPPKGGSRNGTTTAEPRAPRGRKPKDTSTITNSFANLPSVPTTTHLEPACKFGMRVFLLV
jgi:hypothetical protein